MAPPARPPAPAAAAGAAPGRVPNGGHFGGAGSVGAGWGNGRATAVRFAREGASVAVADIDEAAAEQAGFGAWEEPEGLQERTVPDGQDGPGRGAKRRAVEEPGGEEDKENRARKKAKKANAKAQKKAQQQAAKEKREAAKEAKAKAGGVLNAGGLRKDSALDVSY